MPVEKFFSQITLSNMENESCDEITYMLYFWSILAWKYQKMSFFLLLNPILKKVWHDRIILFADSFLTTKNL